MACAKASSARRTRARRSSRRRRRARLARHRPEQVRFSARRRAGSRFPHISQQPAGTATGPEAASVATCAGTCACDAIVLSMRGARCMGGDDQLIRRSVTLAPTSPSRSNAAAPVRACGVSGCRATGKRGTAVVAATTSQRGCDQSILAGGDRRQGHLHEDDLRAVQTPSRCSRR